MSDNTAGETMTIAQAINARVAVGCCPCDRCAQALEVIEAHMSALDALREAVKGCGKLSWDAPRITYGRCNRDGLCTVCEAKHDAAIARLLGKVADG